jgi:hypothetical protein
LASSAAEEGVAEFLVGNGASIEISKAKKKKKLGAVGGVRLPSSSLGHKAPFERLGSRGSHPYGVCQHRLGTDGRMTKGSSRLKRADLSLNVVDRCFHGREVLSLTVAGLRINLLSKNFLAF